MAEAYGPTSCSSSLALESTLSRSLEAQYGFRLKLCHQSAKTVALAGLKTWSVHPMMIGERKVRVYPVWTKEGIEFLEHQFCSN